MIDEQSLKKFYKDPEKAEKLLKASGQRILTILENIQDGFFVLDHDWRIIYVNKITGNLFGINREDVIGKNIWNALPGFVGTKFYHENNRAVSENVSVQFEELYAPLKKYFEVNAHPNSEGLTIYFKDITERKRSNKMIDYMVYYDDLTGLPNLKLFKDRLGQAISYSMNHQELLSVLYIDLDRFKTLNDTLGSQHGDMLLAEIAKRLLDIVPDRDTVSHPNSDKFVLYVSNRNHDETVEVVERIMEVLSEPVMLYGNESMITPSIGISVYPFDGDDAETLISRAESALFQTKQEGRNQYRFYTDDMDEDQAQNFSLVTDLHKALDREEFMVHYQPQFHIESGAICGVEALVRWQHPTLGLVSPGDFIPLAEDSGYIIAIGHWVLKESCRQVVTWQKQGLPSVPVSVNFSARQFQQDGLAAMVKEVLEETGLDPALLKVEVTESVMMTDLDATVEILHELKDLGTTIVIDDFGTYYSSLRYLKNFPLDVLKIDRSFVDDMMYFDKDKQIVKMLIDLAHRLGLRVVAEGIETEDQLEILKDYACEEAQGYLYSKPIPGRKVERFMRK